MKTVEPFLEKLSMLDLKKLSEEQRRVVIVEIKSHLDHFVPEDDPDEAWLSHRVVLLKYWHELVKLRLASVQANIEPPHAPIKLEPLLTKIEEPLVVEPQDAEQDEHPDDDETLPDDQITIPEPDAPDEEFPRPRVEGQEEWVDVILTQPGVIRGMQLPAGITVTVSPEDGAEIVEQFRGKLVKSSAKNEEPQE